MIQKLDKQTQIVQKKYNRYSKFYDRLQNSIEKNRFSKWREKLLESLKGSVLEVGVGTGKNLPYYNEDAKVVGIDLSPKMLEKAKIKLNELNNENITLIEMDAQKLEFKDNSFDYVVCTFVLCSVPDQVKVLKEMKRVCKKNGKILMIEHMLSDYKIIAFFEHLHNPITRTFFGFNVNRKTIENIKKAGLMPQKVTNLAFFDVFRKIEIENNK